MKIYVHGNCQAPALGDLIAQACGDSVQVKTRQVFDMDLDAEGAAYREDVAIADVILTQPVTAGYRGTDFLSADWLRANAQPHALVLTFPVIYHRGLMPQCFTIAEFHHGRLAYHDAHALDFFLMGRSAEEFVKATEASNFFTPEFVRSELALTSVELLRREYVAEIDISVSGIIASKLLAGQPMHSVNHPSRAVLAEVADRILGRIGREERSTVEGLDMLDLFVVAPYLSTALAMEHSGDGVWLDQMRFDGKTESRLEFYDAVFEEYGTIGKIALAAAMNSNTELVSYLKRYRAAMSRAQDSDERLLVEALYRVFFGRGAGSDEVMHHLRTLAVSGLEAMLSAFPRSSEFQQAGGLEALSARYDPARQYVASSPNRIPHSSPVRSEGHPTAVKTKLWRAIFGRH